MVLLQYALLLPLRHAEDTVGGIQLVLIGSPYGTPCCVPHWQEGVTLTALSGIFVLSAVLLLSFPAGCSLRFEVLVQIQEANTGLSPHLPGAHCHCPAVPCILTPAASGAGVAGAGRMAPSVCSLCSPHPQPECTLTLLQVLAPSSLVGSRMVKKEL